MKFTEFSFLNHKSWARYNLSQKIQKMGGEEKIMQFFLAATGFFLLGGCGAASVEKTPQSLHISKLDTHTVKHCPRGGKLGTGILSNTNKKLALGEGLTVAVFGTLKQPLHLHWQLCIRMPPAVMQHDQVGQLETLGKAVTFWAEDSHGKQVNPADVLDTGSRLEISSVEHPHVHFLRVDARGTLPRFLISLRDVHPGNFRSILSANKEDFTTHHGIDDRLEHKRMEEEIQNAIDKDILSQHKEINGLWEKTFLEKSSFENREANGFFSDVASSVGDLAEGVVDGGLDVVDATLNLTSFVLVKIVAPIIKFGLEGVGWGIGELGGTIPFPQKKAPNVLGKVCSKINSTLLDAQEKFCAYENLGRDLAEKVINGQATKICRKIVGSVRKNLREKHIPVRITDRYCIMYAHSTSQHCKEKKFGKTLSRNFTKKRITTEKELKRICEAH